MLGNNRQLKRPCIAGTTFSTAFFRETPFPASANNLQVKFSDSNELFLFDFDNRSCLFKRHVANRDL
jgi:hypothetical protein